MALKLLRPAHSARSVHWPLPASPVPPFVLAVRLWRKSTMTLSLSRALRIVKRAFFSRTRSRILTSHRRSARSRLFFEPLEDRRLLAADISVTKAASPEPAIPGGPLNYTIVVQNIGDAAG